MFKTGLFPKNYLTLFVFYRIDSKPDISNNATYSFIYFFNFHILCFLGNLLSFGLWDTELETVIQIVFPPIGIYKGMMKSTVGRQQIKV